MIQITEQLIVFHMARLPDAKADQLLKTRRI